MSQRRAFYFIDKLDLFKLFLDVIPAMRANPLKASNHVLYCVESSKPARFIVTNLLGNLKLEYRSLDFKLMDIKDEAGTLWWLKVLYFDFNVVLEDVASQDEFLKFTSRFGKTSRIGNYLLKAPTVMKLSDATKLSRSLFFIRVSEWFIKNKLEAQVSDSAHVFVALPSRMWSKAINSYAARCALSVIEIKSLGVNIKESLKSSLFGEWLKGYLYSSYASSKKIKTLKPQATTAGLMAEYYGQLNLNDPQFYCDMFFYQSAILGSFNKFLTFNLPNNPLDQGIADQLSAHGIKPILLHPKASRVDGIVYYDAQRSLFKALQATVSGLSVKEQLGYEAAVQYWQGLFEATGTKVYTSWFKYSEEHMAIADAIKNCGGVATIYQRAFEEFGSVECMVDTDIVFGFSPWHAKVEAQAHSRVKYHVAVGYVGDHRFELVKETASQLRVKLKAAGATKILAYFDENSIDDERWYYGHGPTRSNYEFLLKRVLEDKQFALVLKPKIPSTLRKRLGPVANLLAKAVETGRCYIFEAGNMHGSFSPAVAALSADIAVHGHLFAATAAVESALAGVPTLIMDKEGWRDSLLYRLNKGRVVFQDWPRLWEACEAYWHNPQSAADLGDWSAIKHEIDPFQDGKARERMAMFIKWLLEGFDQGLPRQAAMAQACERYSNIWGKDKIHETR